MMLWAKRVSASAAMIMAASPFCYGKIINCRDRG
jgi:hypothetical protein